MTDPEVLSTLIKEGVALLISAVSGGYVLYRGWKSRTRKLVDTTRDAKNEEIGAYRAEIKAKNQLIRRLEADIAYLRTQLEQCWEDRR